MISDLHIHNYRLFTDFSLDSIARVNLIVGTNNSGKSSLLESIYLLTSTNPFYTLLSILNERGEIAYRAQDPRYERRMSGGYQVAQIFQGRDLRLPSSAIIASNGNILTLLIEEVPSPIDTPPAQATLFDEDEVNIDDRTQVLVLEHQRMHQEPYRARFRMKNGLIMNNIRPYTRKIPASEYGTLLVTASNVSYDELAVLWDTITLTPREEQVVESLKILEPRVERMSFTSRQASNSGVLLKLRGEQDPVPLGSMGDGMRRILAIVASLVSVENGTLLVDEIDTGLYYAVLTDMWRLILETAARLNVQVFATTHSWDCVQAFQQALQSTVEDNLGQLIRLEKTEQFVTPIVYSRSELDIAIQQNIEVR